MIVQRRTLMRRAYYGKDSAEQVGKRFGLSAIAVRKFWQAEKEAGRLPAVRPHFAEHTTPQPAAPVASEFPEADQRAFDAADRAAERTEMKIPDADPLLAALRAVHAGDQRRHADTVTDRRLLAQEAGSLHQLYRVPSPAELQRMRIANDNAPASSSAVRDAGAKGNGGTPAPELRA